MGMVLSCFEILHSLFLDLIFVNALLVFSNQLLVFSKNMLGEMGSIDKKQCINLPSAMVQ
jgi:hypothetical protein